MMPSNQVLCLYIDGGQYLHFIDLLRWSIARLGEQNGDPNAVTISVAEVDPARFRSIVSPRPRLIPAHKNGAANVDAKLRRYSEWMLTVLPSKAMVDAHRVLLYATYTPHTLRMKGNGTIHACVIGSAWREIGSLMDIARLSRAYYGFVTTRENAAMLLEEIVSSPTEWEAAAGVKPLLEPRACVRGIFAAQILSGPHLKGIDKKALVASQWHLERWMVDGDVQAALAQAGVERSFESTREGTKILRSLLPNCQT